MFRRTLLLLAAGGMGLLCAGCVPEEWMGKTNAPAEERVVPPEVADTVGEYASLVGGGSLLLDGHGLVVGLGRNGSSEVPPQLKKYVVEYMLKQKVGSALGAAPGVTPSQMIADLDTAVVRMIGVIPPGTPVGWPFDVQIVALGQTGTRSLDGGTLYPFPLYVAQGVGTPPPSGARAWAEAEGSVFVSPFLDPARPADAAQLREGRLIGGGKVVEARPLRLILREPDYARCNVIQRRINQRFGQPWQIANAKNASTIELKVPPTFRDDYEHFLQLVLHLPLQAETSRWEAQAREIAAEMVKAGANHDGLSLVWEAMGSQVVDVCRSLYSSRNPAAAFYSARAGIRLQDKMAGEVLTRFAQTSDSPHQVAAIEELGRNRWMARSVPTLRQLVDDPSEGVRIAAYEALVKMGDTQLVTRVHVGGEFVMDLVTSRRSYVIYATQTLEKRIVLFGRDMAVRRQVFFNMPGDLVTLCDKQVSVDENDEVVDPKTLSTLDRMKLKQADRLMVFRTIPRTGGISEPFYIDFLVRTLVDTLGQLAQKDTRGKVKGLELTYGQVVSLLYRMCEVDKDIPAKFVLQPLAGEGRIFRTGTTVGRPDMPGD
ncbi:MAG TPA: flagellar basal body P-ring protein FlgI [Phycisphaerae bacterium]|nr:flagellar basal body P-ring protein FlgI [Phycisphaerae bacterium]